MKANNIFKFTMLILFVIFIALFITQSSGYYDFYEHQKTVLTDEARKKFEEDVKKGEKVDINNYMTTVKKEYGNKISNQGLNLSKAIDKYTKKGLDILVGGLNIMFGGGS